MGEKIRDFRLDTLDRKRFYLHEHRGKPVVLVFWATTCSVCKKQLADIRDLKHGPNHEDATWTAVCIDPENLPDATRIVRDLGVDFSVLLDTGGQVSDALGIEAVPTTLILDPGGRLVFRREGYDVPVRRQIETAVAAAKDKGAAP